MAIKTNSIYVDRRSNDLVNAVFFVFSNSHDVETMFTDALEIIVRHDQTVVTVRYDHSKDQPFIINGTEYFTDSSDVLIRIDEIIGTDDSAINLKSVLN